MKILSKPRATFEQCEAWLESKPTAHPLAKAMLPLLWDGAIANGIDPCILIAQAMKETGYFNFKGVIRPNFCNTCGLKVTKGGGDQEPNAHKRFEYWEDGIMAHSDHLALYAGGSNQPKYSPECGSHTNENCKGNGTTLDPRHFTYLHGKCPNVEDLGGNWAPSKTYGTDIVSMVNDIINTEVTEVKESGDIKQLKEENDKLNKTIILLEVNIDLLNEECEDLYEENKNLYETTKQLREENESLNETINNNENNIKCIKELIKQLFNL